MTTNILTKALNQLGESAKSSPLLRRWVNLGRRLSGAAEAFRLTWKQGYMPPSVTKTSVEAGPEDEAGADGMSHTGLVPTNFAHFSDGVPLTEESFLEWKKLNPYERAQRNSKHLQKAVVRWQELKDTPVPMAAKTPKLKRYYFVFMHIPKAGGTTLQHILSKTYLPNQLIHANGPEIIRHPGVLFNMRRKEPRPIITGHFDRGGLVYEFLNDRPIIHFTMLRDPVKRVLSHFNYLKTRKGHRTHAKVKDLTLEEYLMESSIRESCNKQTLRILGYSSEEAVERSMTDPEPLLEEAKQVLEQEFTFFGLTERYTEFLLMARALLGWQDIVYQRRNSSKRTSEATQIIESNPISDEALQLIRDRNQLDIQLYAFANELFDQRCKMLGIDDAAVETYDQISQTYQTVLADLRAL